MQMPSTLNPLLWVSFVAGLTAAVVEMVFVLPIQALLGNSPIIVFQSIAFGVLGRPAFHQGLYAASIGVGVHLLVSFVSAAGFVFTADRWRLLLKKPVVSGIVCGFVAYLVMNFVVIPLSVIGLKLPKLGWLWLISFSIHLFAFGLPISLVSRAMLWKEPPAVPKNAD
jgi:hypothetical protein